MSISDNNPHVLRRAAYEISYWSGNSAAGIDDKDKNRADLQIFVAGFGMSTVESFKLPEQASRLENWQRALARVYEAGKRARSREILKILSE